jgi:hypothetical protein
MFTVDSQILRLADTQIDLVWRHQRHETTLNPVAADELFAAYFDELVDDEHTEIISLGQIRSAMTAAQQHEAARYHFDDVLRQAIAAEHYSPLG